MTRLTESRTFRTMSLMGLAALVLSTFTAPTPAAAEDGQKGQLHLQKVCPPSTFTFAPGSYCTVTVSDLAALPANTTKIYYDQPAIPPEGSAGFLVSPILVYVDTGNWATGRCTVDLSTARGLCTVSDGIGRLAGFSARINVQIDFATGITYWDGTYSFEPLPPR